MTASLLKNGTTIGTGEIANLIAREIKVHLNLGQEVIFTTEDKVRIVLMHCLEKLESRRAWIAPLSVFIAIAGMLVTTSFKDFHFLKAAVSEAFFILVGLACAGWFVISITRVHKAPTVDEIVSEIKKSASTRAAMDSFPPDFWKDYQEILLNWRAPEDRLPK